MSLDLISMNCTVKLINKVALSAADDKRVIQDDLVSTLAIGHYRLAV
jgi:hypothetical protein